MSNTMQALLCEQYGPPESLVLRNNFPRPVPGDNQVLIKVSVAAVNFPDVLIIQNKYQFHPPLPFPPGGEVAGEIVALGKNVSQFSLNDRVLASCGWGGFAQYAAVDASRAMLIPNGMDDQRAAAFLMTYGTSHHALQDRAALKKDETLLVLGAAGGVGLAAVELGVAMGARVVAAASSNEKLELCKQRGAQVGVLYPRELPDRDAQKSLSASFKNAVGENGADVIYDPVGGSYAEPALRSIAWKGRYLVVGFAAGEIPRIPLNLLLLKGCDVQGVFWGAFVEREKDAHAANMKTLAQWFQDGRINPCVTDVHPLERGGDALRVMADRKALGKVVVAVK